MMLKRTSIALALGAGILAAAAALRYTEGLEIISGDAATRTMQVLIGLTLAAYANVMPKDIGRWRASARAAARSQPVELVEIPSTLREARRKERPRDQ